MNIRKPSTVPMPFSLSRSNSRPSMKPVVAEKAVKTVGIAGKPPCPKKKFMILKSTRALTVPEEFKMTTHKKDDSKKRDSQTTLNTDRRE